MMQRIARLTPLADVASMIETLAQPVRPRQVDLAAAHGRVLAEDCLAPAARPEAALALQDGWAVRSADLLDASNYSPVPLAQAPQWLDTGAPVPPGYDAVAPVDGVVWRGAEAEAVMPVTPGDGVLPAAGDVAAGACLRRGGTRLRRVDVAALAAAGLAQAAVRAPTVALIGATGDAGAINDATVALIAGAIAASGGTVLHRFAGTPGALDAAFQENASDAVIAIGGTGLGRRDATVQALARIGRVAAHGVAVSPGETAALGTLGRRPVLLLPGRLDAALAIWLLLGRPMLARLCGGAEDQDGAAGAVLSRKVSASLGLANLVLVRCANGACAPLASGYLSLASLAQADGWLLVPPESEGYPAGTPVTIRPLP